MKPVLIILLSSLYLFSCSNSFKEKTIDIAEIEAKLNNSSTSSQIETDPIKNESAKARDSLRIEILFKNDLVSVKIIDSTRLFLPKNLIDSLKFSIGECPHCYGLIPDSLIVIDLLSDPRFIKIEYRDMNFDGVKDIGIPIPFYCCSGHNVLRSYWLYDKEKKTYIFNETLSNIPIHGLNAKKNEITGGYRNGLNDYSVTTFQPEKNDFKIIKEIYSSTISDTSVRKLLKKYL